MANINKKPVTVSAPLAVKRMGMYGTLPEDYFVQLGRRENPMLNGTTKRKVTQGDKIPNGRPRYMQPTETSRRKDLGMGYIERPKVNMVEVKVEVKKPEPIKLYGPPMSFPAVNGGHPKKLRPVDHAKVADNLPPVPGQSIGTRIARERRVTSPELEQIRSTCRYVRRKGSIVEPLGKYNLNGLIRK